MGCSTPPKPRELVELEEILKNPETAQVKQAPGAGKYYRKSRQYRRVSLEAYQEGQLERAKEYAMLGKLKYRTAAAVHDQVDAKSRLEAANAKIGRVNPEIQALSGERDKLRNQVNQLQRKVARAENRQKKRQRADVERNNDTTAAEKRAVNNKVEAARQAKQAALKVKADQFAKGQFNRANNQLKSTLTMATRSDDSDAVVEAASDTIAAFEEATRQARPKYRDHQAKMKPAARRAAIRQGAENNFGAPFTVSEPQGVRVVLAMLFDKGATGIRPSSKPLVKAAADLANNYDEAQIVIQGYTRKGNATENLTTSALRAKSVRTFFESHGIDDDRISTNGLGQDQIRYRNDPSKNDRVEIIYRIPSG